MLQPLRQHAAQRHILSLASQLGQQLEAPRIVCHAVSLVSAGSFPFCGACADQPQRRHAASKSDANRASLCGAWADQPQRRHAASNSDANRADAAPMAANVVHERQGDRPPDIISKALAKGPPELPFPAKAFYLGRVSSYAAGLGP